MFDMEARRVIEALRSGVPSRAVGQYFSEARPQITKEIAGRLEKPAFQTASSYPANTERARPIFGTPFSIWPIPIIWRFPTCP